MDQLHVKNHFVSECYLKNWEDKQHEIHVYRILVSHPNVPIWSINSKSGVAYQKHLYTQLFAGKESDEFEKWLDKAYESPANPILQKVIEDKKLKPSDWTILINFLAAQDVRTPARLYQHLERGREQMQGALESSLQDLKEKLEKKTPSTRENSPFDLKNLPELPVKVTTKALPDGKNSVVKVESYVGRASWLFSIKFLLKNTSKILHQHKWTILKPAKGFSWPTSDNPVVKLNFTNVNNYNLKGAWGKNKGNIIFPIGPNHAMFTQIGDKPPMRGTRLPELETQFFKRIICENSNRFIFSNGCGSFGSGIKVLNNDALGDLRTKLLRFFAKITFQ